MAIYKQQGSNNRWYKFTWSGRSIRESTKQANKRVAITSDKIAAFVSKRRGAGFRSPASTVSLKFYAAC
jgi:hypothetical protein